VASAAPVEYNRGWNRESTEIAFLDNILVLGASRDCATGRLATLVADWTLRAVARQRRLCRDKVVFNIVVNERTAAHTQAAKIKIEQTPVEGSKEGSNKTS
jgi:hypothetical protein